MCQMYMERDMAKHMCFFSVWMNKDAKWRLDVCRALMSILLRADPSQNLSIDALIERVERQYQEKDNVHLNS